MYTAKVRIAPIRVTGNAKPLVAIASLREKDTAKACGFQNSLC
jgi:hypothetical protein